ncbi:MAG: NUDIX domain-containing protein [Eubacterium sp.]|nr:NUDIX domain-containing protein [Eubacterium sp.]
MLQELKAEMINYDCGFIKGDRKFRCRAGGFIRNKDRLLFVKTDEPGGYYYMIGGGVHICETSRQCAEREIFEETGVKVEASRLAVITENFFRGVGGVEDGYDCHTIEFYYLMEVSDEDAEKIGKITDQNEELVWIPISEVEASDIKPGFIRERIHEILNTDTVLHIIEERDR